MRIALDAKRALNNFTGLGNYSRLLLNALMQYYPDNDYLLATPKIKEELFHELHGRFELVLPETKFQQAFNSAWRSFGVMGKLMPERINIYHGLSNELPFNIHKTNIPAVVTIHDLIFLKHKEQYPFIDRCIYELKTRYAVKHAAKIIAVSNETKKDLVEMYKVPERKIAVIYQSVDAAFKTTDDGRRTTEISLPPKFILNVGSFFQRKNQKKLIEAFATIKDKIEEDLVLVGSAGNMRKEIEEMIAAKGLSGRVRILTNVSNADMPFIYRAASVFVFPSLLEGFGIPVLEALYAKVPVIASNGGAIEEAGGPFSKYVNPNSAQEIAAAIINVLGNGNQRKEMVDKGYEHALTMSAQSFADKTMQVYKEVFRK